MSCSDPSCVLLTPSRMRRLLRAARPLLLGYAGILLLLLSCVVDVDAQATWRVLDSLHRLTTTRQPDTVRVLALTDLCYHYRFINQDSALMFGKHAIDRASMIGYEQGLAQAHSDVAFVHYDRGVLDSAISHWLSALRLREKLKDEPRVASLRMKLGAATFRAGRHDEALQYQLEALRTYETLGMSQGVAQAMNNVAAVYEHQRHLPKALEYYQKSFEIHEKNNNPTEMATALLNIGNIHFRQGNMGIAEERYRRALALLPDGSLGQSRAIALNNLSEIFVLDGRYDSALLLSESALSIRKKLGDLSGTVSSLNLTGRIYGQLKQYEKAEAYLLAALDSATIRTLLPEKERIYLNLHEVYKQNGDWRRSLTAHEHYTAIRDSLLNEKARESVAEMQVRYDTEKKDKEIQLQKAELAENKLRDERNFIVIAGLAVTLVLLALVLILARSRFRRKQQLVQQEKEIEIREVYIRATIESQENERKRFARDLHDGLGQWISALKLVLSGIQRAVNDEEKLAALEQSDRILKDINHEFRSIAFNLMPQVLIQSGLRAALSEMVQRLNTMGTPPRFVVNTFDFPDRLSEIEEISLYRVIQEWTNNVIKYASASFVSLQLTGHDDELIVMIEDDGSGFDVQSLNDAQGNGWKNIRSRMNLVQGSVDVDSMPGRKGTTFTLRLTKTGVRASARSSSEEITKAGS